MNTAINSKLLDWIVLSSHAEVVESTTHGRQWTEEEDQFLRDHLSWLTDEEIGAELGRTATAVHIRWTRELHLPSPSKAPDILTAETISNMMGLDGHKIIGWVDQGFLPGRIMAGKRRIHLIKRQDFMKWVLDPQNWMYFKISNIKDSGLKKQLEKAAKRWGDEWWSTRMVARHHGLSTSDIKRHIQLGRIKATQIKYSYGGRHPTRKWSYWFVLKSEATRVDLAQYRGSRQNWCKHKFTRRTK